MSIGPPEKFAFLPPILTGCRTCLDTHSARPRCAAETAPGRTQDPGSPPPRLSPACCDDCSPTSAWPLRRAVSASRSRDCRRWLVAHPEAFIYEPVGNKRRLVGVEYIVDAATWLKTTTTFRRFSTSMPSNSLALRTTSIWTLLRAACVGLARQCQGAFVDWNNNVTCERQKIVSRHPYYG